MMQFLKDNADVLTAVVAALALIQPWIISLVRRFLSAGKIEIYPNERIEIGFANFGPSIALTGTLRSVKRDVFIRTISLVLVRKRDGMKHVFEWGFFRDQRLRVVRGAATQDELTAELAGGVLLSSNWPWKFNIFYHDKDTLAEIIEISTTLGSKWVDFIMTKQDTSLDSDPKETSDLDYAEFRNTRDHLDAYTALDRLFYWTPGEYEMTIDIATESPKKNFRQVRGFTLVKRDSDRLRLNVIGLLQATCGQHPYGVAEIQYNFASPIGVEL